MYEFKKSTYESNKTLAIGVFSGNDLYCMLTVNLDYDEDEKYPGNDYTQYVDDNNCPEEIITKLIEEKKITPLYEFKDSGFCTYGLFSFNKEWVDSLKEIK